MRQTPPGSALPHEFLPLRTLGNALIVLLVSTVALSAADLAMTKSSRGGLAWEANIDARPLVVLARTAYLLTVIVVIVWFRRARINAQRQHWPQRYSRAWTFWGWIVPVANFWIPLQIMDDIWRAGHAPGMRGWTAWLPTLWWTSWVLSETALVLRPGVVLALRTGWAFYPSGTHPPGGGGPQLPGSWLIWCLYAIAGLTLAAMVRTVSTGPVGIPSPDYLDFDATVHPT